MDTQKNGVVLLFLPFALQMLPHGRLVANFADATLEK